MLDLADGYTLSPAQLDRLQEIVASCEHSPEDFADAFRGEYLTQSNLIDDMESGDLEDFDEVYGLGKAGMFLKPNNTKRSSPRRLGTRSRTFATSAPIRRIG